MPLVFSYVGDGYATGWKEEEDSKTLVCDKSCMANTCVLCRYLHLTLMVSGLLRKDLLKGK